MFTITVSEKGGQQSTFEFNKSEITIGRMKGNDIVLPKANVSKKHSIIVVREGGFAVSDLGSLNGTYVNGERIAGEKQVLDGDKIYIGDFSLQIESLALSPPPPPPGPPSMGAPLPPKPPVSGPFSPLSEYDDLLPDLDPEFDEPMPTPQRVDAEPRNRTPGAQSLVPAMDLDFTPIATSEQLWKAPQEDVTVDRPGDRRPRPTPPTSGAGVMTVSDDVRSEFDPIFHAAQHDVATVLFDSVPLKDFPLNYPPSPEDRERLSVAVKRAIKTVSPRVDHELLGQVLLSEATGLGCIETYLDDTSVQDIYVNRFDRVSVRRDGELIQATRAFSHPQMLTLVAYRLMGPREVEVLTDEVRFSDGTRVHLIMPPLSVEGPVITVRKPNLTKLTIDELIANGVMSAAMGEFLENAIRAGRSVIIGGPTSAGKSTLLGALVQMIPTANRIVSIEDHAQLMAPANAVRLETNAALGYDSRHLIRAALKMHPQRIILDECRGPEAYDWVTAAACGTEGSLAALHGTSAADVMGRLESLCIMGSHDLSPRGIREQIARAVNIVVVVSRVQHYGFRVQQIAEVQGVDLDAFRLNDIFYFRVEGQNGQFHPTGYVPLFYEDMRHAGADVDFGIFRE